MLTAAIILGILALFCVVMGFVNSDNVAGWVSGFVTLAILWMVAFFSSLNFAVGSKQLTGYIYSSSDKVGYTTAHIRFSQNAGTDAQPEFCVKTDSTPGKTIQKYVGSETKVTVNIPSYFYFANNPFACGTTNMTIKEAK